MYLRHSSNVIVDLWYMILNHFGVNHLISVVFTNWGRTDGWTDGPMDGQTDGPTDSLLQRCEGASKNANLIDFYGFQRIGDGQTDGPTDGWTDRQSLLQRCEDASKNANLIDFCRFQ